MRILLLLRGAPGCGKSTWIEENGLKPYTLSADSIRLLYQSPVMRADGTEGISPAEDDAVWKTLFKILHARMQRGEFTVIDATNSRTAEIKRYQEMCNIYKYRIYCVDFTDIPSDEVKRRNAGRDPLKRVSDTVIDTMYARFHSQKVPSGIQLIKPDELDAIWIKLRDLSCYKKIHHIGDLHGCNTVLQRYLSDNGGLKEDEMYIFVGDYIDRGIENAQVTEFLISIMDRKNVLMLEGNHDRELWEWAHDRISRSNEFELITKPELEEANISKKEASRLYKKLGQCAFYKYGKNIYLVTHGGLSRIPENLSFVSTRQIIEGVGTYDDTELMAETFCRVMPENFYQIHGHRNAGHMPTRVNERVYNLEGQVEYGGCLRCAQVSENGIQTFEMHNNVYRISETDNAPTIIEGSVAEMIIALRHNKYIQEKKFGNISSFNYTDQAFTDKAWNCQTVRARGLYLDTVKSRVVARAYDKFFHIGEREDTKTIQLCHTLQFPVTAYVKENGFLGIISYNEYEDDLFYACKSTINSKYAYLFKAMIQELLPYEKLQEMKDYIREKEVSFVFECINIENDPHIIAYPQSFLILLDIVYNRMDFSRYDYRNLRDTAALFGLSCKEKAYELADWNSFYHWRHEILKEGYLYQNRKIEGFVIEDSAGYMIKQKLSYYNFWKKMRGVLHEVKKKGCISNTSLLATPVANEFYGWLRRLYDTRELEQLPEDICTVRKLFYQNSNCCHVSQASLL